MSRVSRVNECEWEVDQWWTESIWLRSRMIESWMSSVWHERVMSRIWMSASGKLISIGPSLSDLYHTWLSHGWVMSRMYESCHVCEWMWVGSRSVMDGVYLTKVTYDWVMDEFCLTWTSHVFYIWINASGKSIIIGPSLSAVCRVTYDWVMNESWFAWMNENGKSISDGLSPSDSCLTLVRHISNEEAPSRVWHMTHFSHEWVIPLVNESWTARPNESCKNI